MDVPFLVSIFYENEQEIYEYKVGDHHRFEGTSRSASVAY